MLSNKNVMQATNIMFSFLVAILIIKKQCEKNNVKLILKFILMQMYKIIISTCKQYILYL